MTEQVSIAGRVELGRQVQADFGFYVGLVGVRERAGWTDAAFFAAAPRVNLPVSVMLDGERVQITALSARPLDPTVRTRDALCAITVVIKPEA